MDASLCALPVVNNHPTDWWSNEEMDDQRLAKTILAWSDVHEW